MLYYVKDPGATVSFFQSLLDKNGKLVIILVSGEWMDLILIYHGISSFLHSGYLCSLQSVYCSCCSNIQYSKGMETSLTLSLGEKKAVTVVIRARIKKKEKPLPAVWVQTAQINYGVSGQSSQVASN